MPQQTRTPPESPTRERQPGAAWPNVPHIAAPRPSALWRLRRKLRRWRNELRSIYEERMKRPSLEAWPVLINLNHTTVCNLRCIMCEQALDDIPQKIMEPEVYHRIRDELFERASEVSLTVMGDPLCVPKSFLDELLDDIDRFDLRLEITTNATLFGSDEDLEKLSRVTNKMVISMDGATKETFERIRVRADWERTVANIERFCRIRSSLPVHRRPLLYLNYVVMQSNLDELPLFIEHAHRWGAYSVTGSPMISAHPSIQHEAIRPDDPHVQEVVHAARELAYRYGISFRIPGLDVPVPVDATPARWNPSRITSRLKAWWNPWRPTFTLGLNYLAQKALHRFKVAPRECGFLWNKAYLQFDGTVSTCCHPSYIVTGNVAERSFHEIWNGKRYRALRETLNTDHPAAPCADCHLLRR